MKYRLIPAVLALSVLFGGCAVDSGGSAGLPASEESSAAPAHRPEAPAVELSSPDGVVTPVVYQGDGVYRMGESQPADGATDLYDLFCLAAEEILPEGELPRVNSISAPKGYYVEWDLSADWLERYTVDELEWFGNTLWMTLSWNSRDIASMAFLVDGQPGLLGEDTWQAPPLRLLRDSTAADFTAIRAQVPYSGLVPVADYGDAEYDFMPQELQDDPVALEIRRLLTQTGWLGEFTGPEDVDQRRMITTLIWATPSVTASPAEPDARQELIPLIADVSAQTGIWEDTAFLKEHIEQSARLLFGEEMVVQHQRPWLPYIYWEEQGIYTPPHMGGGWSELPILLSYQAAGEGYTARVAYLQESMGGIRDAGLVWGEDRDLSRPIPPEEVLTYAQEQATQWQVTIRREQDGRLTLRSCRQV
ncbi:MAG: hypothetical protein KH009_00335 [Clostridiales bacterium]|nr:hypothetical protein [Clostridiales bacterium]